MSKALRALFFISGCAALLYQVVWQRTLFSIYGINAEAVTMVVTVFMFGLGLGSLAGGTISKNPKRPAILYFALAECSIGVFGLVSMQLFHVVGRITLELSPLDPSYPGGPVQSLDYPDVEKGCWVASRARVRCDLPSFVYLTMPNDHKSGVSPSRALPETYIAVNDEATGILVDGEVGGRAARLNGRVYVYRCRHRPS